VVMERMGDVVDEEQREKEAEGLVRGRLAGRMG